jgi:nucleotide-binding universal stress UspA family protein
MSRPRGDAPATRAFAGAGSRPYRPVAGVAESDADLLVLGARGVGGLERLLLGSVAEGALDHARVSVLIAR